jgi:hypothetical protein
VPAPRTKEFRDDVMAIALSGEAPIAQIAKDFGIANPACASGCTAPTSRTGCVPV